MIETAVEQLAVASLGIGLVVALAMTLRAFVRRDAVMRYRLLVLFLPLVIGIVPLQIIAGRVAPEWTVTSYAAGATDALRIVLPETRGGAADDEAALVATAPGTYRASTPFVQQRFLAVTIVSVYLAGAAVGLLMVAARVQRAVHILRGCCPVRDPATRVLTAQIAAQVGMRTPVRVLEHDQLSVPACWGLRRPAVIFPAGRAAAADGDSLRCALHHEMVHLHRRDPLVALIQMTLVVAFWFHPLVWLYDRAMRRDRELSCDALVVRATQRPRTYALALLAFCEGRRRATALAGFGSLTSMQRRLEMISHARVRAGRTRATMIGTVAAIGVLAIVVLQSGLVAATRTAPDDPQSGARIDARPRGSADLMKAEIHAPKEGRGDGETLNRIVSMWETHGHGFDLSRPGQWVTDQETIVAAELARLVEHQLMALEVLLNLPEGSHTRAVFEGERVIIEPGAEETRITVVDGTVCLVDREGVVRARAEAEGDGTLHIAASLSNGEVAFVLRAVDSSGRPAIVRVTVDTETGRPEGEEQPPHKANRFILLVPEDPKADPVRVKMQWIYDLFELKQEVDRSGNGR